MSTLHTISKPPGQRQLEQCLALCRKGDAILFIEDGVYHGMSADELDKVPQNIPVFGLHDDLKARALLERSHERLHVAKMQRFVELSCEYDKVLSWF